VNRTLLLNYKHNLIMEGGRSHFACRLRGGQPSYNHDLQYTAGESGRFKYFHTRMNWKKEKRETTAFF